MKEFTAITETGAIHSCKAQNLKQAKVWASFRLNTNFVVIQDSKYPKVYGLTSFESSTDPKIKIWKSYCQNLYNKLSTK